MVKRRRLAALVWLGVAVAACSRRSAPSAGDRSAAPVAAIPDGSSGDTAAAPADATPADDSPDEGSAVASGPAHALRSRRPAEGAASPVAQSPGPRQLGDASEPAGDARLGVMVATAAVHHADQVVAGLRVGFRRCYGQGLLSDSTLAGKLLIAIQVAPDGTVTSASPVSTAGLPPDVVSCILRKARSARFDPPGGTGSTLQLPITFVAAP